MKRVITVLLAILMAGCSTINYNFEAKTEFFTKPPIDEIVEVYVGDYMINQGKSVSTDYLVLAHSIDGISYDIPKGSYLRIGDYKGTPYFSVTSSRGLPVRYLVGIIDPPIALHPKENEVCVTTDYAQVAQCYGGQFKIEERTVTGSQAFQQTLIYNGSVGEKINISYREFSDGIARNAFTNNVEYDMTKSNTINYKGSHIEVIGYDNTSIKFRVLKHFRVDHLTAM